MQRSLDSFFKPKPKRFKSEDPQVEKQPQPEHNDAEKPQPEAAKSPLKAEPEDPSRTTGQRKSAIEYLTLTNAFEKIEATTKRLEITQICTDLFTSVIKEEPQALPRVTYLCINRLGPDYEGLELGLGESLIIKALSESTGRSPAQVKKEYNKEGDLGKVAQSSKSGQSMMFKPQPLTVDFVFDKLTEVAKSQGRKSQEKKITIIKQLLVACRGSEPKYLVRSLEGKLRIGLAEKSVLVALSHAFAENDAKLGRPVDKAQAEDIVKDVFSQMPNYELIIDAALKDGILKLPETVKLTPGVPLKPMLAKPTKSLTEVLDRFQDEPFTCEYKYDGERAQVHCTADGTMHVYSRNMEDMSVRYPDIIDIIPKIRTNETTDFILDCEAVAWSREQNKILPFQVLSTRKRKDVESGSIKIRVHLFVFDVLYLNGEPTLTKSLDERRTLIENHFNLLPGEFSMATHKNSRSVDEIQEFLDQSIKDSCEGLMIKILQGAESWYEPSKRSRNWLKLKKDYLQGIGDSLDLVVLGAYFGRGKRTNVYGGFLCGVYNPDTEEYETVCKLGTGFSEADLDRLHQQLSPLADSKPKSYIAHDTASNQQPDVWFEPKYVWEILTADLSMSPVYRAGATELQKGVSLRFPRFIREREDKGPEDATTSDQLVELYRRQVSVQD